jgi:hypothetical protein
MDDLAIELQKIYDSEINIRIGWLWDGGIDVYLGDDTNGYVAHENVQSAAGILPWLQTAIAHFYPKSTYAQSLGEDLIERAKTLVFRPPAIGARVTCPQCGAPHAAPAGMTELIFFTSCPHCGAAVKLEPPRVQ